MKRIIITFLVFVINAAIYAQAPLGFSYQAVVRDVSGNVLVSQQVGFRISILEGSESGESRYTETHTVTTKGNGLVNLTIGRGSVVSGNFASINWPSHTYFLQVEIDAAGGFNYLLMGTSQLLSVPYALHAKTAENGFSGDYNDLTNKPIVATAFSGDYNDLTNKPIIATGFSGDYNDLRNKPAIDNSVTNEIQTISRNGSILSLSRGGGTAALNIYRAGTGIEITTANEIRLNQTSVRIGDRAHGGIVFAVDATGTHGLVVSEQDIDSSCPWHETFERVHDPSKTGGKFFDWRMPSRTELFQIRAKISNRAGGFNAFVYYWCGTDNINDRPGCFNFGNGEMNFSFPKGSLLHVRAVRAF